MIDSVPDCSADDLVTPLVGCRPRLVRLVVMTLLLSGGCLLLSPRGPLRSPLPKSPKKLFAKTLSRHRRNGRYRRNYEDCTDGSALSRHHVPASLPRSLQPGSFSLHVDLSTFDTSCSLPPYLHPDPSSSRSLPPATPRNLSISERAEAIFVLPLMNRKNGNCRRTTVDFFGIVARQGGQWSKIRSLLVTTTYVLKHLRDRVNFVRFFLQ
jgi:hypothetical protein